MLSLMIGYNQIFLLFTAFLKIIMTTITPHIIDEFTIALHAQWQRGRYEENEQIISMFKKRTGNSDSNTEDFLKNMSIAMCKKNQQEQVKLYSSGYSGPLLINDLHRRTTFREKSYNWAIFGFGVRNFMSYAAYFCKNEALNGTIEVVSIGSGDGYVDRSIMEAYQAHFGTSLNITLVDKDPRFEVDYATVNELIDKRPDVVRNCVSLIIWPEPQSGENEDESYDIESIRKLQPRAVLIAYEPTGISGSQELVDFLSEGEEFWNFNGTKYNAEDSGLQNYAVKMVAYQEVHFEAGKKGLNDKFTAPPGIKAYRLRMVKLTRTD